MPPIGESRFLDFSALSVKADYHRWRADLSVLDCLAKLRAANDVQLGGAAVRSIADVALMHIKKTSPIGRTDNRETDLFSRDVTGGLVTAARNPLSSTERRSVTL
jgi:hypothetical protein